MKRLLLLATVATCFSANALAAPMSMMPQSNCGPLGPEGYISVGAGAEWLKRVSHKHTLGKNSGLFPNDMPYSTKLKSSVAPLLNLGAGWYANENYRFETTFTALVNPRFKGSTILRNAGSPDVTARVKHKTQIYALMAKFLFDMPLSDQFGFYAGPGIGISMVKDKSTVTYNNNITSSHSGKNKINPAAGVFVGVNIPLDTAAQGYLEGNYTYYGKSKYKHPLAHLSSYKLNGKSYQGFGVSTGVRLGF